MGFDFVRVDCAELLLEDVSHRDADHSLACMRSEKSINAIVEAAGETKLFLECFTPNVANFIFSDDVYVVDCSFVLTGGTTEWNKFEKASLNYRVFSNYVPLLGGHDQMPFCNRYGHPFEKALTKDWPFEYIFTDIATEVGYFNPATEPTDEDAAYDASLENPNKRWLGRFPIADLEK